MAMDATVVDEPIHATTQRTRRRWIALGALLVVLLLGGAACLALDRALDDLDNSISVTNGCGFDIYADDGRDGLRIRDGETIRWGTEGPMDKTIWVWRGNRVEGVAGLEVELRGDSLLTGSSCPRA